MEDFEYEVLIPAFDSHRTLARAIRSAWHQAIPPQAVRVCIDAGPRAEELAAIAEASGASNVATHPVNRGVGAARRTLLSDADSEYIVYLDSDDALLPNASRLWRLALSRHPDASIVSFGWLPFGVDAQVQAVADVDKSLPLAPQDLRHIWERNPITSSAALIDKSSIVNVGGFETELRRLVDYDAWLRMAKSGMRIYTSEYPIVLRDVRSDSITGNVSAAVEAELALVERYRPSSVNQPRLVLRSYATWLRGYSRHLDYSLDPQAFVSASSAGSNQILLPRVLDLLRTRLGRKLWNGVRSTLRRSVRRVGRLRHPA